MADRRINIGFLINDLEDDFAVAATKGAHMAAVDVDANLIIFAGRFKSAKEKHMLDWFSRQYNSIFSYPSKENLDLLVVSVGTVSHFLEDETTEQFFEKFGDIPIVTIAIETRGRNCVMFDETKGLTDVLEHLIIDHGAKKIAFVAGPEDNEDSNARLAVYKEVLTKHSIDICDKYITYGDFSEYKFKPIDELVEKYGKELDAICCANDVMAELACKALVRNGLVPGKDVAVTGYDNSVAAAAMEPALTTVSANAMELGYQSVVEGVRRLKSGEIRTVRLRSEAVIRQSCGCEAFGVGKKKKPMFRQRFEVDIEKWYDRGENADLVLPGSRISARETNELLRSIFNVALGEKSAAPEQIALRFKEEILSKTVDNESMGDLRDFMAAACRLAIAKSKGIRNRSDALMVQALLQKCINDAMHTINYSQIRDLSANMVFLTGIVSVSSSDFAEKYIRMLMQIDKLGIKSSYFYLLDKPHKIVDPCSESVFDEFSLRAYHRGKDFYALPPGEVVLRKKDLLSNRFIPDEKRHTLALSPLFSTHEHYGLLLCEVTPDIFYYIQAISRQVSTVLETDSLLLQINYQLDEEQARNEVLKTIATRDELTSVYNRRGFFDVVEGIIHHSENKGKGSVFIFADVDRLKYINDTFSHEDGDIAIKAVGKALTESFEGSSIVGRIGGDEFVAYMAVSEDQTVSAVYDRIKSSIERQNKLYDKPYTISASIGVVYFVCCPEVDVNALMEEADRLLHVDKQKRNNQ
ncbi:MAG: GGDEF domain-containing protein [Ruminococcaceae bacterium]|nr:GGDEF domain-containing protein [Oscillospiraceae bacterium]